MSGLDRDILFVGLTRPPMLLGVTFGFAIGNAIATMELFLIFRSFWVLLAATALHGVGWLACLSDLRFFDVWLIRVQRCPRPRSFAYWRCNSYRA